MRVIFLLPLLFLAPAAMAGPGACMQTLIEVQEGARSGWLRGATPTKVRSSGGHNDVVLYQRENGAYVINEGKNFYQLTVAHPLTENGKLLGNRKDGADLYSIFDTEATRLVTPQGNVVDLHFLKKDKATVAVLRSKDDDRAYLQAAAETARNDIKSAEGLIKKRNLEYEDLCKTAANSEGGTVASLGRAASGMVNGFIGAKNETLSANAKARLHQAMIDELKNTKEAAEAKLVVLDKLTREVTAKMDRLANTDVTLTPLSESDANGIVSEVAEKLNTQIEVANLAVSDTDRKELKTYCDEQVKIADRVPTASEKFKASLCESLPEQQQEVCNKIAR